MSTSFNPMKKRKANDGRATTDCSHDVNTSNNNDGGGFLSSWFGYFSGRRDDASAGPPNNENFVQQSLSKMDRMEQIMMRVEEKLSTVSSLESRCEQLEKKCSSLETLLESTSRIDKTLKYHEMLIRNQNWKYPAHVFTMDELGEVDADYDDDEADYIYQTSAVLKRSTEALRRGDFPDQDIFEGGDKGIYLDVDNESHLLGDDAHRQLAPHWRQFAAALKHFKPAFDVLPDDCETSISFLNTQLNWEMTELIKESLMNISFKRFSLQYSYHFHGGMRTIAEMMGNNRYLQKLDLHQIQGMDRNDIDKLCSAIHCHPSLVDVTFNACFNSIFGGGLGDYMLRTLISTDDVLKLERLSMPGNNLPNNEQLGLFHNRSNVCTQLSDFLATNPRLKALDLNANKLNYSDAVLIANALRSNTTLRHLHISGNDRLGDDGIEALRRALCDESSLNSVSDSNHSCFIDADYHQMIIMQDNVVEDREINRAEKIYGLLSSRNETVSNVHDFGGIDVNLLPRVLEAVQKYAIASMDGDGDKYRVEALSIVYEVMRRWEKVAALYKLH